MLGRIITRKEYMAGRTQDGAMSHDEYHGQFVTDATKSAVSNRFGVGRLVEAFAGDPHFNSIALEEWDRLAWVSTSPGRAGALDATFRAVLPIDRHAITAADEQITRTALIRIAKAAARIVVAEVPDLVAARLLEEASHDDLTQEELPGAQTADPDPEVWIVVRERRSHTTERRIMPEYGWFPSEEATLAAIEKVNRSTKEAFVDAQSKHRLEHDALAAKTAETNRQAAFLREHGFDAHDVREPGEYRELSFDTWLQTNGYAFYVPKRLEPGELS